MKPVNNGEDSHRFTYSPLPDTAPNSSSGPRIRLLEVRERKSPDQPPQVSVYRTSVEDAPAYQAISYTWADENDLEKIYLEHGHSLSCNASDGDSSAHSGYMMVRKNCVDVLRQLEHFKFSRFYWIDAICINQDDLKEKSVQVARMGDTFCQAADVLICLSMHDGDSGLAAAMLHDFEKFVADRNTFVFVLTDSNPHNQSSGSKLSQAYPTNTEGADYSLEEMQLCKEACLKWVEVLMTTC